MESGAGDGGFDFAALDGSHARVARFAIMPEEFDRGWYVRKDASPFTPTPPAFFTHAEISEIERVLIRGQPSRPERD